MSVKRSGCYAAVHAFQSHGHTPQDDLLTGPSLDALPVGVGVRLTSRQRTPDVVAKEGDDY